MLEGGGKVTFPSMVAEPGVDATGNSFALNGVSGKSVGFFRCGSLDMDSSTRVSPELKCRALIDVLVGEDLGGELRYDDFGGELRYVWLVEADCLVGLRFIEYMDWLRAKNAGTSKFAIRYCNPSGFSSKPSINSVYSGARLMWFPVA